jgi:predicted nucleic acid-binding protein
MTLNLPDDLLLVAIKSSASTNKTAVIIAAMEAARMGLRLKLQEIRVFLSDLLIAAQCAGKSAQLMTRDKHFERIEQGLGLSFVFPGADISR